MEESKNELVEITAAVDNLTKAVTEIKASIEYQSKMIEEIFQTMDEGKKQRTATMPNITAMMNMVGGHPALKNNPEMSAMLKNMVAGMGGANGG